MHGTHTIQLALILSLPVHSQTGLSLREVSPEVYREMKRKVVDSPTALPTAKQVDVQTQAIRHDSAQLDKKLSVMADQIGAISSEVAKVKVLLAEKDMSRVAVLEERAANLQRSKDSADTSQREFTGKLFGWVQALSLIVFTALVSNISNIWLGRRRSLKHTAEVQSVQRRIDSLNNYTEGTQDKLQALAELKGKAEGRAEGIRETDGINRIVTAMLVQEKLEAEGKQGKS